MEVQQLLKLGRGAVVELDRKVGEAIDIYVNNRLVARGEVVVRALPGIRLRVAPEQRHHHAGAAGGTVGQVNGQRFTSGPE